MLASHKGVFIGFRACEGCTTLRFGAPVSIISAPRRSSRPLRVSHHVGTLPRQSQLVVCNFQARPGGRSSAVQPSVPLRKTAKTTVFYTKPKEAPKDTDTVLKSSISASSEGTPSASEPVPPVTASEPHVVVQQDNGTTAPSEGSTSALSSSQEESSSSNVSSSQQEDVRDQQPTPAVDLKPTAEHAQGAAGQLDCAQRTAVGAQFQQDEPPPAVKVTPRVKRPWEQVPRTAAPPVVVSEGGRRYRKSQPAKQPSTSQACAQDGGEVTVYTHLRSRGLTELQAERLSLELDGEHSQFADTAALREQLCRLDRLLPGLDVNVLLCKDSQILTTDAPSAAARLVRLHALLGSPNLVSLLHVAPQLLYAEDVEERVEQCIERLMALLPEGYDLKRLQRLLVEAPTIVFRMDHFGKDEDITSLHDLPPDLVHRLTGLESKQDAACMSCLI